VPVLLTQQGSIIGTDVDVDLQGTTAQGQQPE
jgi:hypothetical protein